MELDRKSMALVWKELEEERITLAVAAAQAMAMITNLQEEKVVMRTEAAQYRFVMEEQSAYDCDEAECLAAEKCFVLGKPKYLKKKRENTLPNQTTSYL